MVRQGVGGAQAGEQMSGTECQLFGTDRYTHASQKVIDTYGAQIGAFTRHIRSGNDQEPRGFGQVDVVAHTTFPI